MWYWRQFITLLIRHRRKHGIEVHPMELHHCEDCYENLIHCRCGGGH